MNKRDIPFASIVQGQEEIDAVNEVLNRKPCWNVPGPSCEALEKELADFHHKKYCIVVSSGSMANLIAMSAFNFPKNSRIATAGVGFPATLSCILHNKFIPVLIDYDIDTLNASLDELERILRLYHVEGIILANTLGLPLDFSRINYLKNRYGFKFILDNCEATGSKYNNKFTDEYADCSTGSGYSSHILSLGGGGGFILTDSSDIFHRSRSLRDWGRRSVRCGQIYTELNTTINDIPYDSNYTYDTIGFNARWPDMNCAYGREQLKRLPRFLEIRKRNYLYLQESLKDIIQLKQTTILNSSEPSYFGYCLTLTKNNTELRTKFSNYLEQNGCRHRLFFAGVIPYQPAYTDLVYHSLNTGFPIGERLMKSSLWVGVHQGLSIDDMQYVSDVIHQFFAENP